MGEILGAVVDGEGTEMGGVARMVPHNAKEHQKS